MGSEGYGLKPLAERRFAISSELFEKIQNAVLRPEDGFHAIQTLEGFEVVRKTGAEPVAFVKLVCTRSTLAHSGIGSNSESGMEARFAPTNVLIRGVQFLRLFFGVGSIMFLIAHVMTFTLKGVLGGLLGGGLMSIGFFMAPQIGEQLASKEAFRMKTLLMRWAGTS